MIEYIKNRVGQVNKYMIWININHICNLKKKHRNQSYYVAKNKKILYYVCILLGG